MFRSSTWAGLGEAAGEVGGRECLKLIVRDVGVAVRMFTKGSCVFSIKPAPFFTSPSWMLLAVVELALEKKKEAPEESLAPLRKEREVDKAEEEQQSEELLKQTEVERQKIIWEWKELQEFLEEQEQRLLSQLEELERAIVQRRDEGLCKLSGEISVLRERRGEKGQQPLSQYLQGAGSTESREDGKFQKPELGFMVLEKRLCNFSLKSAVLQEVLLGFKGTTPRMPGPEFSPLPSSPSSRDAATGAGERHRLQNNIHVSLQMGPASQGTRKGNGCCGAGSGAVDL
ncbi:zinc finger protein RFP-like isoform X2 [Gopherus evgoodei]|uniref:zinc finger protein RFP-like isoform X2 n=1 Tax=Gopherus evgoodei TaxID=1825980 RepID=UPI0011CFBA44|nr:zinc finger protein RFP-like isoform X2 [Gopherus evgoodei]